MVSVKEWAMVVSQYGEMGNNSMRQPIGTVSFEGGRAGKKASCMKVNDT